MSGPLCLRWTSLPLNPNEKVRCLGEHFDKKSEAFHHMLSFVRGTAAAICISFPCITQFRLIIRRRLIKSVEGTHCTKERDLPRTEARTEARRAPFTRMHWESCMEICQDSFSQRGRVKLRAEPGATRYTVQTVRYAQEHVSTMHRGTLPTALCKNPGQGKSARRQPMQFHAFSSPSAGPVSGV